MVGYTFNQALRDYDGFGIPKGAPNKDVAMKFLGEVSKAKYQANLPFHITYGPTNKEAYEVTTASKELLVALPSHPKNVSKMLPFGHPDRTQNGPKINKNLSEACSNRNLKNV